MRIPGHDFLRKNPRPDGKQFSKHNYWNLCLQDLRSTYSSICAYSACWIPTQGSVDHFHPKSIKPHLAYEWENLRFASERINNYKGNRTDVADPMNIQPAWFVLNFVNFFVEPGAGLRAAVMRLVKSTIQTLRLNSDDTLVNVRYQVVRDFAIGDITYQYLCRRYPFIAFELKRQSLIETIKGTFN